LPSRKSGYGRKSSSSKRPSGRSAEQEYSSQRARRAALIQLKFGRASHFLSTVTAVLLAIAAIIAYLISIDPGLSWLDSSKWFIPLFAGAFMSIMVVYLKWQPFLADRMSNHFMVSYISMTIPLLMIALIILDEAGYLEIGTGLWIFPVSFVGISLSMFSIAMIWEGMSRRKTIAMVSALIPFAIMAGPYLIDVDEIFSILPLVYLGSAVCIQLSGSMMHLMSTSTSVLEREILKASDLKMLSQREDLERKEEEINFKERALVDREISLETYEKAISDIKAEIDQEKAEVDRVKEELSKRNTKTKEEAERISVESMNLKAVERRIQEREIEITSKERELEAITLALSKKESQLQDDFEKFQLEQSSLRSMEKQLKEKHEIIEEELMSLRVSRDSLLEEQKLLAAKEKEMQLRQSSMEMHLRSAESSKLTSEEEVASLRRWENKLHEKEKKLAESETMLYESKLKTDQTTKETDLKLKSAEERLKVAEAKEKELIQKESELDRIEKEIALGREDLAQKIMEIDSLRQEAQEKKNRYHAMIDRVSIRELEIAKKSEELQGISSSIESKEQSARSLMERLSKEKQEIESKRKDLLELDKALSAKNYQHKMKEAELRERARSIEEKLMSIESGFPEGTEKSEDMRHREQAIEFREKALTEKERAARIKAYRSALGDEQEIGFDIGPRMIISASGKIGTGTKRLDDLFLGGLPKGSSVLFVGPPFSGKEIGIMSFIADGLRKGVPAIIVTTSRSPVDIAKDFAPVMPDFLEAEHVGLVRWIDATSGSGGKKDQHIGANDYVKVEGPDDFAGIVGAIDRLTGDVRNGDYASFKLAYLSLSTSISHVDEMETTKFVQAMTRSIRDFSSTGMFALEKGMHTEQQIESIQHLMDGSIMIKIDKQKTYLSVIGIGEVQTRDWVEFKHTNASLILGAFSLERIR